MAIEKVVEIKVISEQAKKNINDINSVIDEQRAILVLLEEEYLKAKKAVDDYNSSGKINLAQEKALKKTLSERKDALTDQRLGLKKLAIEQRAANKEAKEFRKEQKETTNIVRGIDKLTGGYATKVVKLKKGFVSGFGAVKNFIKGLSGIQKALIATGIGALVVALAAVVAYWEEINELFDSGSKALQKQADQQRKNLKLSDDQITLLDQQEKLLTLQGKSTENIVAEKKKVLLLQQEQNEALLQTLKLQLEKEKSQVRELSFLEKSQIKTLEAVGQFELAANIRARSLTGSEEELEKIKELEEEIQNARVKSGQIDIALATIDVNKKKNREKDAKDRKANNKKKKDEDKKAENELQQLKNRIREAEANKEDERRALELQKIKEQNAALIKEAEAKGLLTEELQNSLNEKLAAKQAEFDAQDLARRNAINAERKEAAEKISKEQIEAETNLQQAKANAIKGGLEVVSQLAGKSKALSAGLLVVEKGLAIAQVISNAAKSIAQAKANLAATPVALGPVPNPMYAVQAVATAKGILATKLSAATSIATIAAQAIPGLSGGGGGGGSAAGLGGGGAAEAQPPSFNIVGASDTNQLADAIGGQTQQPVQAFVVANDVTTAQSLENNIVEGATL